MVFGSLRVALGLVVVLCMWSLSGTPAMSAASVKVFPTITVATPGVSGVSAIAALGSNLPAVADYYGMTADQLRQELLRNNGLRLSSSGHLIQLSAGARSKGTARSAAVGLAVSPSSAAAVPLGQTFQLHSKPDALKTVYLNFQGASLDANDHLLVSLLDLTAATIDVPPFSIDNDPAFSDAERQLVQEIWQRVAEDFAPFDVDVTTEKPAQDRISRSGPADQTYGMDVLLTLRSESWNILGSAGMSSPFSFSGVGPEGDRLKPAFVFYTSGEIIARTLADATSRELGTTLGLRADVQGCNGELYAGQGNSPVNGWAPIMGELSERPLRQFDKGEYFNPGNCGEGDLSPQDDFQAITDGGLPVRADDAGNTTGAATWLPVASSVGRSAASFGGMIASAADTDVFYLDSGVGVLDLTATPAPLGPNADLVLTLRDSAGNVLRESKPLQNLSAAINFPIAAVGRYFLEVKGGGEGDPLVTGYSSYGSVGAYALSGSFATPSNNPPSAIMTVTRPGTPLTVTFDASASSDSDGQIKRYRWVFGDGTSREDVTPGPFQKTYATAGLYTVTLQVTDDTGLTTLSVPRVVSATAVPVPNAAPVASFAATPLSGTAPLLVSFNATASSDDEAVTKFEWNFGNGTVDTTSNSSTPSRTYATPGTYVVTLIVKDADGLSSTPVTRTVTVSPAPVPNVAPVASFSATPLSGTAPLLVSFDATASSDDKAVTKFEWNFGNGTVDTTSNSSTPSRTYATPGTYVVTLIVKDADGLSSTPVTRTVTVSPAPVPNVAPVASFSATPLSGTAPLLVSFDATASSDDKAVTKFEWNFGNGTVDTTSNSSKPSRTYATPGTYVVTLVVKDAEGAASAPVKKTVTVTPAPVPNITPVASFTATSLSGTAPLLVNFDATASWDDKAVTKFEWNFGDGMVDTTSNNSRPSHTYTKAGTFEVKLTVKDAENETAQVTQDITVAPAPAAEQVKVARVSVRLAPRGRNRVMARAEVAVVDAAGRPASKAVVTVAWSGPISVAKWGTTRSNGTAAFTTPPLMSEGCYRLTVTSVMVGGTSHVPSPPPFAEVCR